jgi:ABC-type multidrug transport system ATPase subunit
LSHAFQIENVWKKYGYRHALSGVNLEVAEGECLAILGPNGAGKSTLLRILATRVRPTSGRITVFGQDLLSKAADIRRDLGVVFHEPCLRTDLTLAQNLLFFASLYPTTIDANHVESLVERLGLDVRQHDPIRGFSRGMMQRATLIRSLLHNPRIWLLDEPFTGLDPRGRHLLEALIREEHERGRTIVMVSHDVEQSLRIGQRSVVIAEGELRAEGETEVREYFVAAAGRESA